MIERKRIKVSEIFFIIFLLLVLGLFLLIAWRYNVLCDISKQNNLTLNKTNYYYYSKNNETIMEYWKKENIAKLNMKQVNTNRDVTFWRDGNTGEEYTFYNMTMEYTEDGGMFSSRPTSLTTSYDNSGNATLYISINDVRYQIKQDDNGNYYIENNNGQMEYIELSVVPYVAKVDMKKNTLITKELLSKADNVVKNDMRKQEYNVVVLPLDLDTGDYIDIRLMLPNGQDFIVVSKKEVEVPYVGDVPSADTIWVNLSEDEILHMSSAIVDASKILGAKLYATKYTEPGMQEAAIPTYIVSAENSQLLQRDPNIVESAMEEIIARYNQVDSTNIRNNNINTEIQKQGDQADSNLQTEIEDSVTRSQEARQDYLDSLSSTTTTTTTGTTSTTTTTTE